MIAESDYHGKYVSCLTCGYVEESMSPEELTGITAILEGEHGGRQRRRQPSHGKIKL